MAGRSAAFELQHRRYDDWFVRHAAAYLSELLAVRAQFSWQGLNLSVGVGTGRFAAPLGVQIGIDPSAAVLRYAARRGVSIVQAVAEALPFASGQFDNALCVTTICFVDEVPAMLQEISRVVKAGGALVMGFIDRTSPLGQEYLGHQPENVFYRDAKFFSAGEVERLLSEAGFVSPVWAQTLSQRLDEIKEIEPLTSGYGRGAFVVVKARRP